MSDDDVVYYTEFVDVLPWWMYKLTSTYLVIVCISGILINFFVVAVFAKYKSVGIYIKMRLKNYLERILSMQLWTPFNGIIFNLIFNELLASCLSVPLDLTSSIHHGWSLGKEFCYVSGVIHTMAGK